MKILIFLIGLCFFATNEKSCKGKAEFSKSNNNAVGVKTPTTPAKTDEPQYKLIDVGCTSDERCIVIAYCDPAFFNKEDMENIAEKLSIEFKGKKVVNVNLFDNMVRAKAYAKGTRNLGDLSAERRGWYLRTKDEEFLLFYSDPDLRGKPISVKPRQNKN